MPKREGEKGTEGMSGILIVELHCEKFILESMSVLGVNESEDWEILTVK